MSTILDVLTYGITDHDHFLLVLGLGTCLVAPLWGLLEACLRRFRG